MTTCPHTGITVPECSCRTCLQALIERHMPQAVATIPAAAEAAPTPIAQAPSRRLARLRGLRRVRIRRSA
jgi:hypothetical protein